MIYKTSTTPYYTAVNKEQFSNLKSSCGLAILKLASAICGDEIICDKSTKVFWKKDFWKFMLNVIFNPSSLGFDDRVGQSEYLDVLVLLLNIIPRKLKEAQVKELVVVLRKYVSDNFIVDIDLKRNVNLKQRNVLKGML